MKSKSALLSSVMFFFLLTGYAQNTNESVSNVTAPSSPASAIIGNQPSSIARPKSWQSLETSMFTNFLDSNNRFVIPDNYALEFSPYWAMSNKKVATGDFLAPDPMTSALQNLSVSISSTNNFVLNDTLKTNALGIGLRTMIWQGTKTELESINSVYGDLIGSLGISDKIILITELIKYPSPCSKSNFIDSLITQISAQKTSLLNKMNEKDQDVWIKSFKLYLQANLADNLDYSVAANRDSLSKLLTDFTKTDQSLKQIESLRAERKGFKLELASAMSLNFPTNRVDLSYGSKFGIWVTPSFQPFKKQYQWIEFLGVLRYYWFNQNFNNLYFKSGSYYENNFDYGFKTVLKFHQLSFEMEAIGRNSSVVLSRTVEADGSVTKRTNTKYDSQYVGTLTYQVNETVSVSYHFGKAFKPAINFTNGNLLSMATVNLGLGAPKVKDLQ